MKWWQQRQLSGVNVQRTGQGSAAHSWGGMTTRVLRKGGVRKQNSGEEARSGTG